MLVTPESSPNETAVPGARSQRATPGPADPAHASRTGAPPTQSRRPRNLEQLDALRHWTRALIASPSPASTLERVLRGMCRLLGQDAAAVWELASDGALRRVASHGLSSDYLQAIASLAPGQGATGIAVGTGRVIAVADISADPRVSATHLLEQEGIRAFASAPLLCQRGVIGSLNLYRREPHTFTDDETELLASFADVVAAALEIAGLREGMAGALVELAAKEATLATVVRSAADGIIVIDDEWRVLVFNPACERLTGWRADEVVGRRCFEFLRCHQCGEEALCGNTCPMLPIFNFARADVPYGELLVNTQDGGERWVGASWSVARDEPSGHPMAVMVLRDITAAKEVDQMKSAIIGLVSHELRTPLTSIRMLSELLIHHEFDSAEGKEVLGDIVREAKRLGELIDNILEVARIEGGQVPLHLEPVAVGPIVAEAVSLLRAQTKIHTFRVEVPEDHPPVRADPRRLRQILDNLLANAIKYSPAGGCVSVQAVTSGAKAHLTVSDQGVGIAPEELAQLFEPFRRIPSEEFQGVPGTGLGLHIARSLVERQGGRIRAESTPGQGSSFTFTLPLADIPFAR